MAVGDVFTLQVQWRLTNGTLTAQNQFHFRQTAPLLFDTEAEDLIQAFDDVARPDYQACVSGQWGIVNYVVKEQPSGLTVGEAAQPDLSGVQTGDSLPPQVAPILSFRTSQPGRSGKGRVYLPPCSETNSGIVGSAATAQVNLMLAFASDLQAMESNVLYAGWEWGVWSEKLQAFNPVTGYTARVSFATQRGRTR